IHFFAGGLGGMMGAICTNPLDVIKTRFQSDLFANYSSGGTATSASGSNGIHRRDAGLGSGSGPSAGFVRPSGIAAAQTGSEHAGRTAGRGILPGEKLSFAPHSSVLRPSNLIAESQRHLRETLAMFTTIYRREGPRALYRGLGPNLVGVI